MLKYAKCFLAASLMLCVSAACAQAIGRVLMAAGSIVIVRGASEFPGAVGTAIAAGDRIRTGENSNAQIRFSDGGVVALRPQTDFRIDEYNYTGAQDGTEKAFFSLFKGGLRTITGAVGHLSPNNYGIRTRVMFTGVRGTHFNLVDCYGSVCKDSDGKPAPDGLYGGVTEGRVAITPNEKQDAERQFGAGEFFVVADAHTPARQLIEPPSFLTDKLEGQLSTKNRGGATSVASLGSGGSDQSPGSGRYHWRHGERSQWRHGGNNG